MSFVNQSNHEVFAQQVPPNTYRILNGDGPSEAVRTALFLEYLADVEA